MVPIYTHTCRWREALWENTAQCPWPGLKPEPLNWTESSTLTMRTWGLSHCNRNCIAGNLYIDHSVMLFCSGSPDQLFAGSGQSAWFKWWNVKDMGWLAFGYRCLWSYETNAYEVCLFLFSVLLYSLVSFGSILNAHPFLTQLSQKVI